MTCKVSIPKGIEFRSKLGFKQHDIVLRKEQPMILKIMKTFSNEKTLPQHYILSYQIYIYFPVWRKRTWRQKYFLFYIDFWIKRQKTIEKELDCEFIRINPDVKDYNENVEMGEIYNQIGELTKKFTQEATKKSLTEKISRRLLELEFEESHSIKSKCLKFIVQKYYHHCKTCIA